MSDQRAEAVLEFCRSDERTDHAAIVVGRLVVEDVEPKSEATRIRVAAQVAKILRQHKRSVVLRLGEGRVVGNQAHDAPATVVGVVIVDE